MRSRASDAIRLDAPFLVPLRTRSWAIGAKAVFDLATPDRAGARPYRLYLLGTGNVRVAVFR